MRSAFLIISLLFLFACNSSDCRSGLPENYVHLPVERLEDEFYYADSPQELEQILRQNTRFAELFLDAREYPSDSVLANQIFKIMKNAAIDTLFREAKSAFEDFDNTLSEIASGLGRLQTVYPQASVPLVQTTITGLYKDLVITNDEIIIGMDFFIGPDASFRPQEIPDYILQRYTLEHLPSTVLQFMSSQYIATSKEETMLAEMIDFGKSYYLLSQLLPCTPPNILIGYSEEEWQDIYDNEDIIWANFVENQIIYETNHVMKQKFLGERPNVYEIGEKCPGRIGRWVGWEIVKSYAEKNDIPLKDVLAETDNNKIFSKSGYRPS